MGTYGAAELANGFETVRRNTIQIAADIPESKYDFVAAPEVRSVAAQLTHIAFAPMMFEDMHRDKRVTTLKGYDFGGMVSRIAIEENKHRSKAEILDLLRSEGDRFALGIVPHLTRQRQERMQQSRAAS